MPFKDESRGVWRGQIRWEGRSFKRDFRTKREAVEWEAKTREQLRAEIQPETSTGMDLVSFSNKYLDYARLRFVAKTYDNKQRVCKRFLDHVGNLPVDDVTPKLIHGYLERQAEVRSKARYNEDYKHLRAMWSWGVDILDLPGNPVAKIKTLPHERAAQYTPPTADVLKLLAAATREERVFLNSYLNTGARRSEILRWSWAEDINFERREVRLGTRKTSDGSMSHEWLPMNDDLYAELWWWWKNRPIKDTPYVFVSTSNKPGRHYGKPFKERRWFMQTLCKRAGVKPFGFHALRRYVASVLADEHKVSAKTIQRILRHKNVTTTERYIQNINHDLDATMDLLSKKRTHEENPKTTKGLDNDA